MFQWLKKPFVKKDTQGKDRPIILSTALDIADGFKDQGSGPKSPVSPLPPNITEDVYRFRYGRHQMITSICLGALIINLLQTIYLSTAIGTIVWVLSMIIFGILYLIQAFSLWRARDAWQHWENNPPKTYDFQQFVDEIRDDPMRALPVGLDYEQGERTSPASRYPGGGHTAKTTQTRSGVRKKGKRRVKNNY